MDYFGTQKKLNLKSVSGLSNYRARLDQQLQFLVDSNTKDDVIWLNKLATFLNSWFRAEHLMLTPDSVTLFELLKQHDIKLSKDIKK